ncbi:MAG: hypothetical protein JW751_30410 [Polyangiaceae bacterium]|nr:hypothetical protein [Polyangiaceae bacterium]
MKLSGSPDDGARGDARDGESSLEPSRGSGPRIPGQRPPAGDSLYY